MTGTSLLFPFSFLWRFPDDFSTSCLFFLSVNAGCYFSTMSGSSSSSDDAIEVSEPAPRSPNALDPVVLSSKVDIESSFKNDPRIQLRDSRDAPSFIPEKGLVVSMVIKEHNFVNSLKKAQEAWDSSFGSYEDSICSHFSSCYNHPFSISPMVFGESVLDGPANSFAFYLFPARYGVYPPFTTFEMDFLNYLHTALSMILPNGWLMLGDFQSSCYRHNVTPTIESFLYFHQLVKPTNEWWIYIQSRGREVDCVKFVDDLSDSVKN